MKQTFIAFTIVLGAFCIGSAVSGQVVRPQKTGIISEQKSVPSKEGNTASVRTAQPSRLVPSALMGKTKHVNRHSIPAEKSDIKATPIRKSTPAMQEVNK
jgi:hypothetical protein